MVVFDCHCWMGGLYLGAPRARSLINGREYQFNFSPRLTFICPLSFKFQYTHEYHTAIVHRAVKAALTTHLIHNIVEITTMLQFSQEISQQ